MLTAEAWKRWENSIQNQEPCPGTAVKFYIKTYIDSLHSQKCENSCTANSAEPSKVQTDRLYHDVPVNFLDLLKSNTWALWPVCKKKQSPSANSLELSVAGSPGPTMLSREGFEGQRSKIAAPTLGADCWCYLSGCPSLPTANTQDPSNLCTGESCLPTWRCCQKVLICETYDGI